MIEVSGIRGIESDRLPFARGIGAARIGDNICTENGCGIGIEVSTVVSDKQFHGIFSIFRL